MPWHQRRWFFDLKIILIEAALGADLDNVPEAFRGQKTRAGSPPFDQGIGGQSRAMNDQRDLSGNKSPASEQARHGIDQCRFGRAVRGQNLGGQALRESF